MVVLVAVGAVVLLLRTVVRGTSWLLLVVVRAYSYGPQKIRTTPLLSPVAV